jgi:hypothetical protein
MRTNYPTREIGNQIDYEAMKRNAFKDQGIVVIRLDDPRLTWDQREMVKQVGVKLYGAQL